LSPDPAEQGETMFEHEANLYAFHLEYAQGLVAGIVDEQMTAQPLGLALNHPAWLLGHLGLSCDFALNILGQPEVCPKAWLALFARGTEARPERSVYPAKDELIAVLERGHRAVLDALPGADPAAMAEPHQIPVKFLEDVCPTKGHVVCHLLTSHEATHLGQLSAWRRAMRSAGTLLL
jgi:hypothetical protein